VAGREVGGGEEWGVVKSVCGGGVVVVEVGLGLKLGMMTTSGGLKFVTAGLM
jgi:hypothetical protein